MKTYPLYLNGQFVQAGETIPVVNPATGETFARMSICGKDRVRAAIDDAHAAFASWRRCPQGPGELLWRIADETQRRKDDRPGDHAGNGKPLPQSPANRQEHDTFAGSREAAAVTAASFPTRSRGCVTGRQDADRRGGGHRP